MLLSGLNAPLTIPVPSGSNYHAAILAHGAPPSQFLLVHSRAPLVGCYFVTKRKCRRFWNAHGCQGRVCGSIYSGILHSNSSRNKVAPDERGT
jgi:hypothetical protein